MNDAALLEKNHKKLEFDKFLNKMIKYQIIICNLWIV